MNANSLNRVKNDFLLFRQFFIFNFSIRNHAFLSVSFSDNSDRAIFAIENCS